jgi:hypothetical protein
MVRVSFVEWLGWGHAAVATNLSDQHGPGCDVGIPDPKTSCHFAGLQPARHRLSADGRVLKILHDVRSVLPLPMLVKFEFKTKGRCCGRMFVKACGL